MAERPRYHARRSELGLQDVCTTLPRINLKSGWITYAVARTFGNRCKMQTQIWKLFFAVIVDLEALVGADSGCENDFVAHPACVSHDVELPAVV